MAVAAALALIAREESPGPPRGVFIQVLSTSIFWIFSILDFGSTFLRRNYRPVRQLLFLKYTGSPVVHRILSLWRVCVSSRDQNTPEFRPCQGRPRLRHFPAYIMARGQRTRIERLDGTVGQAESDQRHRPCGKVIVRLRPLLQDELASGETQSALTTTRGYATVWWPRFGSFKAGLVVCLCVYQKGVS